jgi:hypothetical protein
MVEPDFTPLPVYEQAQPRTRRVTIGSCLCTLRVPKTIASEASCRK